MIEDDFLKNNDMVVLTKEDDVFIDAKYATKDNFMKCVLYDDSNCYLRRNTAKKLLKANTILRAKGFCIKIWDAYRPIEIQRIMWEKVKDEKFVANPDKGNCYHCTGSAVDVTLCTLDGIELEMPTEFDHIGRESYREYNELDEIVKTNVMLLEQVMIECGFEPFFYEWWHFKDKDTYSIIY